MKTDMQRERINELSMIIHRGRNGANLYKSNVIVGISSLPLELLFANEERCNGCKH